ncbi:MAG TPA: hemerythrin domain-containing protein [Acidimicrobiales bacterium]|jgi:iron-sulfur cluster repair protein YtfE (RIC family)|nr:hemerythrin domain-containing protein [Acidimicrobiales bacterium]
MADQAGTPRPDVTDMYAVHGVFRDTLGAAPRLIGDIVPGDAARVDQIANYYDNILYFLESHHDGEEAIVFPRLRERCPDEAALLDRFEEEHKQALILLEDARRSLAGWPGADGDSAAVVAQAAVADSLEALRVQLVEHLDEEEARALPLCAENILAEEWGQLPGHALAGYQGDKVWLILGLIRQRMTQEQRDAMLEHMPPPPRDMWINYGENAFNELSAQVVVEVSTT